MKQFIGIFLISCVLCHIDVAAEGNFLITGSKIIRRNSPYEVAVTTFGYDECCPKLQLTVKAGGDDQEKYEVQKIVDLKNDESTKVKFDLNIPKELTTYLLEAKTITGPYFQRSVLLHKSAKYYSVLIQTDKGIYKPTDLVRFRVIVLDEETKPFSPKNSENIDIFITDSDKNRLKQFLNVSLNNGVYKNELQLFDSAAVGDWLINVKVNQDKTEEKSFKVAKYVLPKFQVSIVTDPFLTTKDETLKVTVSAKYTHGKSVKGKAIVTVREYSQEKSTKNVIVNGKGTVEFDLEKDLNISPDENYGYDLQIEAKFTEDLTGNEQSATSNTKIFENRYDIDVVFENYQFFTPGLPFRFHINGKTKDGKPISDEFNKVKVNITQWKTPLEVYCNSTTQPYYSTHNLTLKNGIALLEILPNSDINNVLIRAEYLKVDVEREITARTSRSGEFIQLRVDSKKPSLNDTLIVNVETTVEISDLIYQINNRGKPIATKFLKFPKTKATEINVNVVFAMIPQCTIVVFYFRPNGEVISEEVTVDFEGDLPNYIDLELSKSEVKPDSKLDIIFKTNPMSYVGLLGVDQSSILLGSNDLKPSQIFDQLKEYNSIDLYNTEDLAILSLSDDDYVNIEDENLMERIEFSISNSFIITNRIHIPEDTKSTGALKDDTENSYRLSCRHREVFGSRYACCPLTEKEIATEIPETDYDFTELNVEFAAELEDKIVAGAGGVSSAHFPALSNFGPVPVHPSTSFRPVFADPIELVNRVQLDEVIHDIPYEITSPNPTRSKSAPQFTIRKSFPETWFFEDIQLEDNDNGTRILTKTVPSEITSWIITGFSLNPSIGLGMTMQPTKLRVFQPFFVSVNLPYSIKRGEVVAIPATVFNYQNFELPVSVTLHNDYNEFEFIDINEDENDVNGKASMNVNRTKRGVVPSDDGMTMSFMIRPLIVGHITIKVVATSPVAGDGLEKMLLVEPEGVTKYINKVVLIDLKDSNEISTRASITIPESSIPDSTKIEIGVVGDLMGPTIENLQKLIKLPYGCGEQNMLNFVPNIVVLNYLTTVNKLTPDIKRQLLKYLDSGYQRELQYRHDDGSYSAFGRSDASGSTWLTAFVVKSFGEASKYITVDDKNIKLALDFLKSIQKSDGHFPEVGRIIHKDLQGGSSNGIALTSYILLSFLENEKYLDQYKNTTEKALNYISDNLNSINDTYSMAIVAYALQLANHPKKNEVLDKLVSKAILDDGELFWTKEITMKPKTYDTIDFYYQEPKTLDVEMTAYALRSFISAGKISEAIPIMRWMLKQRNENGGFQSTQDTVVGLQALASLAQSIYIADGKFDIAVKTDKDDKEQKFHINAENNLLLQREEVNSATRLFDIAATGHGFGLLQISYKYNVNETDDQPKFVLTPEVLETSNNDTLNIKVCVNYVPSQNDISKESNMAVMEITLPSGYTLDPENLSSLEQSEGVKKVETKKKETIAIVYFNSLDESGHCLELRALRTTKVANQKRAFATVYDYYDNSNRVTEFYDPPPKTLCDICEGDDCKSSCGKATTEDEE